MLYYRRGDETEEYPSGGPTASRGECKPGGAQAGKGAVELHSFEATVPSGVKSSKL
jgi:hypothetical protein